LNLYLHFIPMGPMPTGVAGQYFGVMASTHYLYVVAVFQVIPGLFLLFNRYVPLGLAVLAPVIFNILVVHVLIGPSGVNLLLAVIVALLWVLVYHRHRSAFRGLFQKRLVD
jgi:glycerol-3-phosphate acyltransferase PlsY